MDSFWDFFWLILTTFLFVAYLLVLFQIVSDLFADRELGGWGKAGWIVLFLLFPLLGSLVYLIVNGAAMTQRRTEAAATAKEQADDYIRRVTGVGMSPSEEIGRAQALLREGAIDEMEYSRLKTAALTRAEGRDRHGPDGGPQAGERGPAGTQHDGELRPV